MAQTSKSSVIKSGRKKKSNYVTKRIMKSAMGFAIKKASAETKQSMGYTIKAEDGWVIREELNGSQTRISKIEKANESAVALD
jgi:hypothetical protein